MISVGVIQKNDTYSLSSTGFTLGINKGTVVAFGEGVTKSLRGLNAAGATISGVDGDSLFSSESDSLGVGSLGGFGESS